MRGGFGSIALAMTIRGALRPPSCSSGVRPYDMAREDMARDQVGGGRWSSKGGSSASGEPWAERERRVASTTEARGPGGIERGRGKQKPETRKRGSGVSKLQVEPR